MQVPLQITFHNMEPSDALRENIRQKAEALEKFYSPIISCRVVIESNSRHLQGNIFHVRIDLKVAGQELVVSRDPAKHHAHEDAYVAVRDAFDAMRRKLEDFSRRQRGKVKQHAVPLHGRILKLNPEEDFGRIATSDGRDIYFHRNSVINASFERLEVGDEVRFDEETGDLGPQATTVTVIGKHHIVQ